MSSATRTSCGVCHSDLHVIKGEIPIPSPCAIGHEITGEKLLKGHMHQFTIVYMTPLKFLSIVILLVLLLLLC
uniref:Alcohol dehydrogenase-like N-terminal domain-containing protein n=1 Tax=Salix viminalis TaxID=40686 RepID=A0A6N2LG68_SALVM